MTLFPDDPITEHYKQFVDRAALRENLALTVEERLRKLQAVAENEGIKRRVPPSPDHPWQAVSNCQSGRTSDPIVELYKQDVDRTLLRENLKLTPERRLLKLLDFMQMANEMHAAGQRARKPHD